MYVHKEKEPLEGKHVEVAVVTRISASKTTCWPGKGYKPKYSEVSFHTKDVTDHKEIRRATADERESRWVKISV